jgi:PAS domain S-box-containing protein
MKTHETELREIKNLLRSHPKGMKITRIAGELAMNRNAAAKFLEILLMTGQVEVLEHGMSKIFILSRRTGVPTMLDRSEDFILILDQEMKIAEVNDNYLAFTGLARDALIGRPHTAPGLPILNHHPLAERLQQAYFGADIKTEIHETVQGREYFFTVRMTPTVFNANRGITLIISDITREKQDLRSKTDENRALIEGILSCIDDAVILLDSRSATISFANPAALRMFNFSAGEMVGKNPAHVIGIAGALPGYPVSPHETLARDGSFETKSRLRKNGNREFPVYLHLRPICNTHGDVQNIVMVIRDAGSIPSPVPVPAESSRNLEHPITSRIISTGYGQYNPAV